MKRVSSVLILFGLLISSCNLPVQGGTDPQIATAAALTVQAALDNAAPLASATANADAQTTPSASGKALITVEDVTNCREGPGTNYPRVVQIAAGQQVEVIGVFPPMYWVVSTNAGICWISADFVTPVGSIQGVPTVTAPPTPEGKAPAAPTFPSNGWNWYCYASGEMDVTFNWRDNADNETGYRILRNGVQIAELPANTTQFIDKTTLLSGQSIGYQIEAYNLIGYTRSQTVTLSC